MILTDPELQQIRHKIEAQAGLNEELWRRCGDLVHMGNFDEAVRSAFVLLEERLREAAHKDGLTGTQLANYALNAKNGPLAKHLARTDSEREGLREIFAGAFKLFRNPTAHGVVGYSPAEGKAIIGLVNLLLILLDRVRELPPPGTFPENVERAIETIEQKIGPGVASRLHIFLGKCNSLGLEPRPSTKIWVPFRMHAFMLMDNWDQPKPHRLTVFYVLAEDDFQGFLFPVNQYYTKVVGLDVDQIADNLRNLGFVARGKRQEFQVELKKHNDQNFFDSLFEVVLQAAQEIEDTLTK